MHNFQIKIIAFWGRLKDYFRFLPIRFWRFIYHFYTGILQLLPNKASLSNIEFYNPILYKIIFWWIELLLLFLDLLGIPEIYETAIDFGKHRTRPLTKAEIALAKPIFKNSINYSRIRIDETARIACKKWHLMYVSFYTINSWGRMNDGIFIHEMVHVWQYQNMGAIYISRALMVQNMLFGYNYGGLSELKKRQKKGENLSSFNLEQQADIIADYFKIKNGLRPSWGNANLFDLSVYQYFVNHLY